MAIRVDNVDMKAGGFDVYKSFTCSSEQLSVLIFPR